MEEVQQEFLVTKTLQEVEADRGGDINFVGVYITADDKVSQWTKSFFSLEAHQFPILVFSLFFS